MSARTTHIDQTHPEAPDHRAIGIGAVAVALVSLVFANFVGTADDANGGVGEFATTGLLTLALGAIVFGWAVPRARESGRELRSAAVLTVLAVLGVMAFWSGLSQVTGPAAILLAYLALQREGTSRAGAGLVMALAGLGYAGAVIACIVG